jgi:hypothetical protein
MIDAIGVADRLAAREELPHRFLAVVGHEDEHLVPGGERSVASGHDDVVLAEDGDDGRVAGEAQRGDLVIDGGRLGGEGDLHEPGPTPFEGQEPHEGPDRHGLLDERGEQVRGRDRDVDAPHLVEHPLVLRVVHPGDDAGHAELLLRQQRDDEVVLVVSGDGGDDLGLGMPLVNGDKIRVLG